MRSISLSDSTRGDPSVSGRRRERSAPMKAIEPITMNGNSRKVKLGKKMATCSTCKRSAGLPRLEPPSYYTCGAAIPPIRAIREQIPVAVLRISVGCSSAV